MGHFYSDTGFANDIDKNNIKAEKYKTGKEVNNLNSKRNLIF